MPKQVAVISPYPNLRGGYVESGSYEGRPAFVRQACHGDPSATWIFYSSKFGRGPCWYFGRSLPSSGSMSSLCCSMSDGATPEFARWPADDITEIKEGGFDATDLGSGMAPSIGTTGSATRTTLQAPCAACTDLQTLRAGFRCASCGPPADARAVSALSLLRDVASNTERQRLAIAFSGGDADAKLTLENIAAAHELQEARPVILKEPPPSLQVGSGTATLLVEAFTFGSVKLQYQWCKDGVPLPRAERSRFMLCSARPQDEGCYVCHVSAGTASARTRGCRVHLSADDTARRSAFESPMRRATDAAAAGDFEAAVALLTEAISAAEVSESARASALCRRAELLLKLHRWQDAFRDSTEAVKASPGLARAHAARGAAAVKLELLAEAASSWETAELLGVPEAGREAEACRQRLQHFFVERQEKRGGKTNAGGKDKDHEEEWRRSGWQQGRSAGGFSSFFGSGSKHSSTGGYSGAANAPRLSSELQRNLKVLGLAPDATGALPTEEAVRSAYRRLALQAHPDKPGGSKKAFQELQNAYEAVLSAAASAFRWE
eukprot:gnl/TRDRNA2_/TRDRNA2_130334_c0_seq1.p1 gnl/TRDRNA2_/TRDRNA2_130334_c0~~gnl/TRDRNA2_/TRDRNA2_130334_c0_seq1.p1  ORF type:complete len:551 (-),score=87.21 gnl/TRDRNA2_/TRDRNA2_130334_c0_seq1:22-1674(-)